MLIPSIDLQKGRVVQLVQGEKLALASDDIDAWIEKFAKFPTVQLIDLDAAMALGNNDALVRRIAAKLPCRVGGGVRTVGRAEELIAAGAQAVIAGSALFNGPGNQANGPINTDFAKALKQTIGDQKVIAAVDAKKGRVVIHGWKTQLPLGPVDAIRLLEPFCAEFLYTNVDREGLMQGADMDAIRAVKDATEHKLTAAGGITTREEIAALDRMGIDAVVGMAIYTGSLAIEA